MVKPQDGLDASGYLLMAGGHLARAREGLALENTRQAITLYMAGEAIVRADVSIREALELLRQEKEVVDGTNSRPD